MKEEKSKEKDISRERIDEINRTIRTTRIIKKKIKSCLNNLSIAALPESKAGLPSKTRAKYITRKNKMLL